MFDCTGTIHYRLIENLYRVTYEYTVSRIYTLSVGRSIDVAAFSVLRLRIEPNLSFSEVSLRANGMEWRRSWSRCRCSHRTGPSSSWTHRELHRGLKSLQVLSLRLDLTKQTYWFVRRILQTYRRTLYIHSPQQKIGNRQWRSKIWI